jgi:alpha-N-arabinofuranosidase
VHQVWQQISDFIGVCPDYRPMATETLAKGEVGSGIGKSSGCIGWDAIRRNRRRPTTFRAEERGGLLRFGSHPFPVIDRVAMTDKDVAGCCGMHLKRTHGFSPGRGRTMIRSIRQLSGTLFVVVTLGPLSLAQLLPSHDAGAVLSIQTDAAAAQVSPTLYGLMTEEINHSYDGGIYGELIRNRAFQDNPNHPDDWRILRDGDARASMTIDKSTGPSTALTSSLKLTVRKADASAAAGIVNNGYWGIPLRPNTTYTGSFYAKADGNSASAVTMSLVNNNTGAVIAAATVPSLTPEWKQYKVTLQTREIATSASNHLVLSVTRPGTVWFSLVSLFPPTYDNTPNGNRVDLMEKLAAMHPAFLRLPGGNFLEGDHLADRYPWKQTIGPLVDRPTHPSPWGYRSSDGLGLLEFLEWCQDLHVQPVLAVYAGYSMAQEHVTPGPDLVPYVQSAIEEIEYVSGGPSTQWGAVRAKDGHPAPFRLTYVEVGNEDEFDKSGSYDARFAQFYDAIKKAYPRLQVIATAPVKSRVPDVLDEHFYRNAQEFFDDTDHYDKTDRKGPRIFVGEWATREGKPTPDMGAALADAAWLTGLERNSDIVIMASYAPLFINVNPGASQWVPDLIGYGALQSYGSPSYYAQVMFSNHLGNQVLHSSLSGADPLLFTSVTRNAAKRTLYVKIVNASSKPQSLEIQLNGKDKPTGTAAVMTLIGHSMEETNSLADPTRIVPVQSVIRDVSSDWRHTFPAYSIAVIEVSLQ